MKREGRGVKIEAKKTMVDVMGSMGRRSRARISGKKGKSNGKALARYHARYPTLSR